MGLQFIIGNSGTGKSYSLYQKVLEEAGRHPGQQYLVIVPEQFTMQTQKDFVRMSPSGGILNIDILSFERLAYRIFSKTGGGNLPVLDEIGKIFVVRRVAEEKKEELLIMKNYLSKMGYINEVKSMISELIQYDISGEQLQEIMNQNASSQQIYAKLHDMQVLYEGFQTFLKEKYITSEELLDVLCRVIGDAELVKDAVLVLDGFTGFTPLQKKLLEQMMQLCEALWVTVTYDTSIAVKDVLPDYHLFHMSAKMMHDLKKMAQTAGMPVEEPKVLSYRENVRFADNLPMQWLERGLFRSHVEPYAQPQDSIRMHICKNPYEETAFAAEEIRRLVMTEGLRYRDIAIVTGDLGGYGEYVERIFPRYEIPYFSDYKRNAMANPAVTCIRSLLECAVYDFTYESVCQLWRSGFTGIGIEDLDVLQNYILAKGIRGRKRFEEPWEKPLRGMSEEELAQVNVVRENFITPLLIFVKTIRSKRTNVREKTEQLVQVLQVYQMEEQLERLAQQFAEQGELAYAKEYEQIYPLLMDIFERLTKLLGEEKMDGLQYARLLDAGFAEMKVGIVPPGVDEVTVGDIERSRLKDIRVLFFLGVNDGVIPKSASGAGILSELERDHLSEQGVELAPGREEQYYTQKFYLYLNMTKPKERLYLTFCKTDAQGSARNPSYLIRTVLGIFPNLTVVDEEQRRIQAEAIVSKVQGMDYIVRHYKKERTPEFYALYRWFCEHEESRRLERLKRASADGTHTDQIQAALARVLYGDVLSGTVTRLERYAACAYAHFLQYGIGAKEREEYGFRSLDFGNILHEVLDAYAKHLKKKGLLWTDLDEKEQEELVFACVDDVVLKYDNTVLYYSARDRYRMVRMKRIAKRTVWALTKQLAKGDFVPSRYELQFHDRQQLPDEAGNAAVMELRGRIDRMDVCDKGDKVYVKVVDYKTGKKDFQLLHVYYGLQLQLVVYLQAAMQFEQNLHKDSEIIPAGIVYYRVDDPLVEKETADKDTIEASILKTLRVDGVVCDDDEVLQSFDETLKPGEVSSYESDVIPVGVKKDGTLSVRSKTAARKEFEVMMDYTTDNIRRMGKDILAGDIRQNPYADGDSSACNYCPYHAVCVQKTNGADLPVRDLKKWKDEELYVRMLEKKGPQDE